MKYTDLPSPGTNNEKIRAELAAAASRVASADSATPLVECLTEAATLVAAEWEVAGPGTGVEVGAAVLFNDVADADKGFNVSVVDPLTVSTSAGRFYSGFAPNDVAAVGNSDYADGAPGFYEATFDHTATPLNGMTEEGTVTGGPGVFAMIGQGAIVGNGVVYPTVDGGTVTVAVSGGQIVSMTYAAP